MNANTTIRRRDRRPSPFLVLFGLLALMTGAGHAQDEPATLRPIPSVETRSAAAGWLEGRSWMDQHEDGRRAGREIGADLVFLGDSITQSLGGPGRRVANGAGETWREYYGARRAINLGISGDRTQHLLWRLQHGALENLQPKVCVLAIGTNNLAHDSASEIAAGIRACAHATRQAAPTARIIVCAIFPRGETEDDPLRKRARAVNELLRSAPPEDGLVLDLGDRFLRPDGGLDPRLLREDGVHLRPEGYRIWAEGLEPQISKTLPRRPNILFFMVDDLGWQDSSLVLTDDPTDFNRRYHTPNLERLAARGVKFTQAYAAAPVCTPTRTSLMTGCSPARNHITYWTLHADRDNSAAHPKISAPPWRIRGLDPEEASLPLNLRDAGYRTMHVGKAHFGAIGTPCADPLKMGFDANVAGHAAGGPASFLGRHRFTIAGRQGKPADSPPAVWDTPGLEAYAGREIYMTEALSLEARRLLRETVAAGQPFFLHFAPYAVHAPIMANPRHVERYAALDPREAAYASMIETVDVALGDLIGELEALGQLENTVIVYASDNGGLSAHARGGTPNTHNAPLRSGKGSAYEGGIRVPLVISSPQSRRDVRCDTPVVTQDLCVTLLQMAGARPPRAPVIDGLDLRALIQEGASDDPASPPLVRLAERGILFHQPHQWGAKGPGIEPFSALRLGPYKLIWFHADRRYELYDVVQDPGETTDLSTTDEKRLIAMKSALARELRSAGAQLSLDRATGEPLRLPLEDD